MNVTVPTDATQTIRFPVSGMTCASCVNRITRALKRLDGVDRVRVDLGRELATVRRDPAVAGDAALVAAVAAAGYEARLDAVEDAPESEWRSPLARLLGRLPIVHVKENLE